ncbi:GNAT family N-acetyltransferase [Aeromicrobium wangtongii]|uniref:GNAT family N-acetyltransferase n=1 Tax=Aeromicrobium wangtongii TaxID=2969247 RepID=A0ABY5M5A9_9ACTN|nr:GNAT family N-acetyltransferase [Aeromicrobium wangtongii]MCD9198144.1 GNAT family N-acetyltransferase [Aeromicrobium wangtongii]UUP12183.1 GNAT family N-acetyltransferase [Aeromicrobium wangtongii]
MLWRVRTTLADRPGYLAEIALACGRAEVNIVALQVFSTSPQVTDELVVRAPDGWTDVQVAELFEAAGGAGVSATRVSEASLTDAPTRYLRGAHQVLEQGRSVEHVLRELLETEPPDVADYTGHDVMTLTRRDGSHLHIDRAVPFTTAERDRAQALLSLVGGAGGEVPPATPSPRTEAPVVRAATLDDIEAVSAMHERCGAQTLYDRYQAPLTMPMTSRMTRRLVVPDAGTALVVQVGAEIVAHGVLECVDRTWTFRMIIEDAWQGRGLGTRLMRQAAGVAKHEGAARLAIVTAGSSDKLLRAVGNAGFVARVERHDGNVHITVPLREVRAVDVASSADR